MNNTESVLYNSIQSPTGRNNCQRENNCVSTPIRDYNEETMHINSSIEIHDTEYTYMQDSESVIDDSVALKRKSLFDSPQQREQYLIACSKYILLCTREAPKEAFGRTKDAINRELKTN